jgi:glycosyltransferase involved in cell wall biosynthesis
MITFLIPSYQPNHTLIDLVQECIQHPIRIIVVDDGGQSSYAPIFNALPKEVIVLTHEVNEGKGAALKTGFRYIKEHFSHEHGVVVTVDGDGQHKVSDALACAEQALTLTSSIVLGVRDFSQVDVPFKSRFGNKLTRFITQFLIGYPISDTQTGLRAFTMDTLDFCLSLEQNRYEYEMSMLLGAKKFKIKLHEHPIETVYIENNAASHFNPFTDSLKIYVQIGKFALSSILSAVLDVSMFAWIYASLKEDLLFRVIVATVLARIVSSMFNYFVNKHVVFNAKESGSRSLFYYYALVVLVMLSSALLVYVFDVLIPISPVFIKVVVDGSLFFLSFNIQKKVIFKGTPS